MLFGFFHRQGGTPPLLQNLSYFLLTFYSTWHRTSAPCLAGLLSWVHTSFHTQAALRLIVPSCGLEQPREKKNQGEGLSPIPTRARAKAFSYTCNSYLSRPLQTSSDSRWVHHQLIFPIYKTTPHSYWTLSPSNTISSQYTSVPLKMQKHDPVNTTPPQTELFETNTHVGQCYVTIETQLNQRAGLCSISNWLLWALLPIFCWLSHTVVTTQTVILGWDCALLLYLYYSE